MKGKVQYGLHCVLQFALFSCAVFLGLNTGAVEVNQLVFKTVHVTAITGAKDSNTKPEQVTGYIQTLQTCGVNARYIEVSNATHEAGILGAAHLRQVVQNHLQRQ